MYLYTKHILLDQRARPPCKWLLCYYVSLVDELGLVRNEGELLLWYDQLNARQLCPTQGSTISRLLSSRYYIGSTYTLAANWNLSDFAPTISTTTTTRCKSEPRSKDKRRQSLW